MKQRIITYSLLLFLAVFMYSCSDSDSDPTPINSEVKMELQSTVTEISETMDDIHETNGYRVISVSAPEGSDTQSSIKNNPLPDINISLEDVRGVFNYSPTDPVSSDGQFFYSNIFTKTEDSESFIVKVPIEKALEPWNLHIQQDGDDQLTNNLEITASDYTLIDSEANGLDYTLNMSLSLDNNPAGNMFIRTIQSSSTEDADANVDVRYEFTEEIEATVRFIASDNNVSQEFTILENDEVLYKERASGVISDAGELQSFEIRITIDNIELVRSTANNEYIIFRDGEQEDNVEVEVMGQCGSPEQGFCRDNLNLEITFEDGTSINLATSLGDDTLDKMEELFNAMYQVYFVQFLVDNVAINYTNQNNQQQ